MSNGDYIREYDLYSRRVAQVIDQVGIVNSGTSTGSADAYVLNLETLTGVKAPVRLLNRQRFYFVPNFTNAAANPTVTISAKIGAKVVKGSDGTTALVAGAISSGYPVELEYDQPNDVLRLIYSSKPAVTGVTLSQATITATYGSRFYKQTVTDAAVSSSSKIMLTWGNYVDTDENEPEDSIAFNAKAGTGNFEIWMQAGDGDGLGGVYKFNYLVG